MIEAESYKLASVADQLVLFGLTQEVFDAVALAYFMAGLECTENDPLTHAGFHRWARANRVFRDFVIPMGWCKFDFKNIPLTVHPSGKFAVVAINGDSRTGIISSVPCTKTPKGLCTAMIVGNNAQLQIDMFKGATVNNSAGFEWQTWVLLIYQSGSDIRMELSLPLRIDSSGNIITWGTRIVLNPVEFGSMHAAMVATDFAPDPDVPVTRRVQPE